MLNGNLIQQILLFFVPVFLGYLFQQLYNTFDAIIVGRFVGKQALAAVGGSTSTMINLLVNFILGLSSGVTVLIAQYYGSGYFEEVKKSVKTGMFMAVVLGGVMMIAGYILTPWLLSLLNVPADIIDYSITYMRVYFLGSIPVLIYNVGSSILRATGDSKRPLIFLIIACITNIVFDILFVTVFKMEVFGVALSTVLSEVISCVLILYVFKHTSDSYQYSIKDFGFDSKLLKKTLYIGLPAGIQSVLYSVSNLSIQASVNSFGTDTIAAYTAFGKIDALYWNYDSAFGIAVMTVAGQNYGARNIKRIKDTTIKGTIMELIGSTIIVLGCLLFGKELLGLFTDDINVINIGLQMLSFLALAWPIFNIIEVISSVTKACGDVIVPMVISAIGICVVRILWLSIYPFKTVVEALWCYPISWIITAIAFIIYYIKGSWIKIKD